MSRMIVLLVCLMATVGCHRVRKKSPDFIQPLVTNDVACRPEQPFPESERDLCIQTAQTVAKRGHFTEAIALYEQAEKLEPSQPLLNRELAPLYAQAGQTDRAVLRYQRAIDAAPDDAELINNLAWTLLEADRPTEAIQVIEKALTQFPEDRRLQSTRAVASYHTGDREGAIAQFTELYGPSAAYHNIALLDIEAGDRDQAKAAAEQSIAHQPTTQTIRLVTAIDEAKRTQ